MTFVKARSGYQVLFAGVLLCLLALLWMRAAVIIYALSSAFVRFRALTTLSKC